MHMLRMARIAGCKVAAVERTALVAFVWADSEPVQVGTTLLALYPLVYSQNLASAPLSRALACMHASPYSGLHHSRER